VRLRRARSAVPPGARAPPEPSEEEFPRELERLEGIPKEALADKDVLRVILPALRADAALYRNYVYASEPPLELPIWVYGGADDPNVRPEHLEGWRGQTTRSFHLRQFPGGHFFMQAGLARFLGTLREDLSVILPTT